jgi:branched-chain amino acid transport system substrate-binding protein
MFARYRRGLAVLAGSAALLVGVVACGGSSAPTAPAAGATRSPGLTVTVGVLADITGPAGSANKSSVDGVRAGTFYATREGVTVKFIVADTATNPASVLSQAQKLVTQDHVFAVLAHSALFFAAAPYLTAHGVPVIGFAEDGQEWYSSPNMFSITGPGVTTQITTTIGSIFKMLGATNVGAIGYSISPGSEEAAIEGTDSAKLAGLKVGYLNAQLPFGTTDVGPTVLAMKSAGIDSFFATVDQNTAFALLTGLRNQGVKLKAAMLPTGYGGDLVAAGPGAQQDAQGVYFSLGYEPVEMQTAATKQFQADLTSAGITGEPTFAEYNGYLMVGLLVRALTSAGPNPTPASLLTALRGIHDWTGLGLFGSEKIDINLKKPVTGECLFVVQYVGTTFRPVKGALPACGTLTTQTFKLPS